MRAQLEKMEATVHLVCTEQEARVIQHVFSFIHSKDWREKYSQEIAADVLDNTIYNIRAETERILRALDSSRRTLMAELANK